MMNQTSRFLSAHNRLIQCLQRQSLSAHRIGQGPANNAAGEHIHAESGVHKAFPGSHIGNISNPQLIQPVRGKVAIDQVRTIIGTFGITGRYRRSALGLPATPASRIKRAVCSRPISIP